MVGLSDAGLYQRSLLLMEGRFRAVKLGPHPHAVNVAPNLIAPTVSLAFDLQQNAWNARGRNFELVRDQLMGSLSGTARVQNTDLILQCPKGDVIVNQYYSNDAPRSYGKCFRGQHPGNEYQFAWELNWVRYSDPTMMTPFERFTEMMDRAVRTVKMRALLRDQLAGLISPETLLMMSGTFFALFGAEIVGGAAAVWAIARIMDVQQFACSYYFYEPRLQRLYMLINNARTVNDLEEGAQTLSEILSQIITDIGAVLGVQALSGLATRLFNLIKALTPQRARTLLQECCLNAEKYIRENGYKAREVLKDPAGTPLEQAAVDMYKRTSEENREILVVREPDSMRSLWIAAHHVWNRAKPPWLKAKSGAGWHGLVCITEKEAMGAKGSNFLIESGKFDMGNLKGVSAEIDALIAEQRYRDMYQMPTDGRDMGSAIDYSNNATGAKNINLQGHKLIQVGDKYIIVDGLGQPYISDLDLATRQQPGSSHAGSHLAKEEHFGKPRSKEDNTALEWRMNQTYHSMPNSHPTHDPNQHGGGGATVVYTLMNLAKGKLPGKDFWSPKMPNGAYKQERLVIFIPEVVRGKIKSNMYVLESWAAFKTFAEANKLEFPF